MATIPFAWRAYAQMQNRLGSTSSVTASDPLEEALNVVHDPDFQPGRLTEGDLNRLAANAARGNRHRLVLLRDLFLLLTEPSGRLDEDGAQPRVADVATSLDGAVIARDELARLEDLLPDEDWRLLLDAAEGLTYSELAIQHRSTSSALRSRVCRMRQDLLSPPSRHHPRRGRRK